MRKSAAITINDRVITINEITVKQMLAVKDSFGDSSIVDAITGFIPLLTDAPAEFLLELAPSEIEEIYEKVKEVNSTFFRIVPLEKMLAGYKETVMNLATELLLKQLTISLAEGTE